MKELDAVSQIQPTSKEAASKIAVSEGQAVKETRGFAPTDVQYVQTLASLRAFASELSPAVQESARKADELIQEAAAALLKSCGFSSVKEFKEQLDAEAAKAKSESPDESNSPQPTIQERMRVATKQDPKAFRSAVVASTRLISRASKYFPHQQIMRGGVLMSLIGALMFS